MNFNKMGLDLPKIDVKFNKNEVKWAFYAHLGPIFMQFNLILGLQGPILLS